MKKKVAIVASLLIALSALQVSAKKKKNVEQQIIKEQIVLATPNDTLAYAYGATLAQQGLSSYLEQLNIAQDSAKLELFVKGLNESLVDKGQNTAYFTGIGIGDQIFNMTKEFSKQAFEDESVDNLNVKLIAKGIADVLQSNEMMIDNSDAIVDKVTADIQARTQELEKQKNAAQIEASKKFMEENKAKEGVVALPSGLQYEIITKGDGEIPTATDNVVVNYKGTLLDGTVFDSSYDRGEPITLGVGQVIKGWTEALQLMPVGSKWMLYVPYDLAYGERGTGPIPAYSDLIFEIDLISIEK